MVEHFRIWNKGDNYDKILPTSDQCPVEFFSFYDYNYNYNHNSDDISNFNIDSDDKSDSANVMLQGTRFLSRFVLPSIHLIAANVLKLETNEFEQLFQASPQVSSLRLNYYLRLNGMLY